MYIILSLSTVISFTGVVTEAVPVRARLSSGKRESLLSALTFSHFDCEERQDCVAMPKLTGRLWPCNAQTRLLLDISPALVSLVDPRLAYSFDWEDRAARAASSWSSKVVHRRDSQDARCVFKEAEEGPSDICMVGCVLAKPVA
jgi:hypothetical protein